MPTAKSTGATYATPRKKVLFLEALATKLSVTTAAKAAGVDRVTAYRWRESDEAFAEAWDAAKESAIDTLETSLFERAVAKDTIAAIFMLKGHRHQYRDRQEITGANGGPLVTVVLKESEDVP